MNKDQRYYAKHKSEVRARNEAYRKRVRTQVRDLKSKLGCSECPERDWRCLDFHHTDPAQKELGISRMYGWSFEKISKEIAKCVVLCSNCHRKHHASET